MAPSSSLSVDEVDGEEDEIQHLDGAAAALDPEMFNTFFSDSGEACSWPREVAIPSTLSGGDNTLLNLCRKHEVPEGYMAVSVGWAANESPSSERVLCVYTAALEAGLRIPLHDFYLKLLRHFQLAPSQLAPNSWRYMAAFVLLCEDVGVEPRVSLFRCFFSIYAHKNKMGQPLGWHHFKPCPIGGRRRLFTGQLQTKAGWKSKFFFLESPKPWKCPTKWGKPRRDDVVRGQHVVGTTQADAKKLAARAGMDVKSFLGARRFPVGNDDVQQHVLIKTEPTGKRKSPETTTTTTSALPLGLAMTHESKTRRMDFGVQHQVGTSSSNECLPPHGMCASDALHLWDAIAAKEKAQQQLHEAEAQVAQLKEGQSKLYDRLNDAQERLSSATAKNAKLEQDHAAEKARLREEYHAKLDKQVRDADARAMKKMVLALFPNIDAALKELSKQG